MRNILLAFLGILTTVSLFAQQFQSNISLHQNGEQCKTDERHNFLYDNDPVYRQNFDASRNQIRNIINSGIRTGGVYTIPVVVHVIHLGAAEGVNENISDAQIQSAIDNLNDAYSNQAPYNGLDIEIQFTLAKRDPFCQPTDGILRINGSGVTGGGDNYSTVGITSNNEETIKALSKWPNGEYYNIWIVTEIDDNGGGAGTQGYAYYPGAGSNVDGAVILYNAFGYDPTGALGYELKSYTNYNVTTIHELGHGLDVMHTFNGDGTGSTCPSNTTCTTDGDECCDTDPHRRNDGSDCEAPVPNTCHGVVGSVVYNNFMAYSSDYCQDRFTADQKARMRAAMEGPRLSLLNSLGDEPISGTEPAVTQTCQPQTTTLPNGFSIGIFSFTLGPLTVGSGDSDSDGGYVEKWCANTTLDVNTQYSIEVINRIGGNTEDVSVYIDYNNDGDFADAGENIFSSNTNTAHSGTFTTPANPVTGTPIWVRVISDFSGNTISGPCYAPEYGQVEDYSITISSGGPTPPVANFSANTTTVCQNASLTFTDASTNATSYSWNFGSGASPATATGIGPHSVSYSTSGTKTVTLDVTGPGGNDNETKTNYITVNPTVTPSVSIAASANPITSGDPVTFTATPNNGGTPSYQWKLNGGNVGTNSATYNSSTLNNGDQVSCVMTSSASCASPTTATSNLITMTVNPASSCSNNQVGPAGVGTSSTNKIWLDASTINLSNGAIISNWADKSGNNLTATNTGSYRPVFTTNQLNGFPSIDFDGTNDFLKIQNVPGINNQAITWFVVGNYNNFSKSQAMVHFGHSGSSYQKNLRYTLYYLPNNKIFSSQLNINGAGNVSNHTLSASTQIYATVIGNTNVTSFTNGTQTGTFNSNNLLAPTSNQLFSIGQRAFVNDMFLDGNVAEVIVYNYQLNSIERTLVENYLSSKYNLSISNDRYSYESSGHYYNVSGIGMESNNAFSDGSDGIVQMNSASSLANNDYLLWGNNNSSTGSTTSGTPSAYGGTGKMMMRTWRADKTNDVGTVTISFHLDGIATGVSTDFELLKDSDGNFTNATRITSGYSYDSNCDIATWTSVNFTDGDYFTIGNPDGNAIMEIPISELAVLEDDQSGFESEESALEIIDQSTESVEMKLYPNPTEGQLTIENNLTGATIEIYNTLGQLVFQSMIYNGKNQYDFSYLNSGIYLVHLKDINKESIAISQLMISK